MSIVYINTKNKITCKCLPEKCNGALNHKKLQVNEASDVLPNIIKRKNKQEKGLKKKKLRKMTL